MPGAGLEIPTLHEPFIRFLNERGIPFIRSRSDRESTTTPGDPDFVLLRGHGALSIEFKTEKGSLSQEQKDRHAYFLAAGVRVHVCRDIDTAVALVTEWFAQAGPVEKPRGPLCIRSVPGHGDFVFERATGQRLRRATINDLLLERG